ncbi:MAG: hypothetical protein HY735_16405 [Verrucomicrobia bacterium]|nr:hypothetical protein [Verrucomicrobiota bacterium]
MIGFGAAASLLGQVSAQPIGRAAGDLLGDIVMILIIGAGVLFGLMGIARLAYTRRRRKKHIPDAKRVFRNGGQDESEEEPEAAPPEVRRRYKYRWKRRHHRVRNPTLAETGGLPPPRPEEPSRPS